MPGFPIFWYREGEESGVNQVYHKGDTPADKEKPEYGLRYLIKHSAPNRKEMKYVRKQLARGVAPSMIRIPLGL